LNKKIAELKTLLSDKSSFEPRAGTDQCQNTSQRQSPSSASVFFHQFSPLKPDVALKVQCLICSKILESSRGFSKHLSNFHPKNDCSDEDIDILLKDIKEAEKGTCRLESKDRDGLNCGKKFTKDQIKKHIKTHYAEK